MRRYLFALSVIACLYAAAPANAQHWGLQAPGRALSNMGIVEYQSRDWAQCTGSEQAPSQRAISACGRIIGERASRDITASALYFRSELYRQGGDTTRADADVARAVDLLRALVAAEPDNADYLNNLTFLRVASRDFEGAAEDYEALAARRPNAIEPRLAQGWFYFRASDYQSAIASFDAAAQLDPTNALAQSGRCEARAAANAQLDVAERACAEAMRLGAGSAPAYFSNGFLKFKRGDLEGALADFHAAGVADNTHSFSAYGYAVTSIRLGRSEERARELLANVTSAVPDVEAYAQAGMQP